MATRVKHTGTPAERFKKRVILVDSGCWEFDGYRDGGYGKFGVSPSESVLAHRFAYELWVAPLPGPHVAVHHRCENPACVRPDHLEAKPRGKHSIDHAVQRGHVVNQFGVWPVTLDPRERQRRGHRRRLEERTIGRTYFERGNPVTLLIRWQGKGPRNVLIRRADGSLVVRSFRGLRRQAS